LPFSVSNSLEKSAELLSLFLFFSFLFLIFSETYFITNTKLIKKYEKKKWGIVELLLFLY
jgi:phosphate starvation-inducible membrane PsiE